MGKKSNQDNVTLFKRWVYTYMKLRKAKYMFPITNDTALSGYTIALLDVMKVR